MGTYFYVLVGILAGLSIFDFVKAMRMEDAKARKFGMWLNGALFVVVVIAVIVALLM